MLLFRAGLLSPSSWAIRRAVSSFLTPLGVAFNSRNSPAKLGFLDSMGRKRTGLFGLDVLSTPQGFDQLRTDCMEATDVLVEEALSDFGRGGRTRLIAKIFDDLSDELCRVADLAEFVRLSHPELLFRMAAEETCVQVSNQVERLNTHKGLYDALNRNDAAVPEKDIDRHVAKLFLLDFQQCGIHLDGPARENVVKLNNEILQLGQVFGANAFAPSVVPESEVPSNFKSYFHAQGDSIVVPCSHSDHPSEDMRAATYKLYHWADPRKEAVLERLLDKRLELARACGYQTFAHRAMLESLAENPETVNAFLLKLSEELKPRVECDFDAMSRMKIKTGNDHRLQVWDVPYLTSKAKTNWLSVDVPTVSEYFSLGVCMEGLDELFGTLFNVRLVVVAPEPGEVWHDSVYKLVVKDRCDDGAELGVIYCDFFTREDKPHQDCHFTIRGGRLTGDGRYQNPVVVVMLSFPNPGLTKPTLLTASMLDNLFHEMGHAMHSMLARTEYQHVTGTRCSTDFAEVPSTLMEYFASDPRVLHRISKHHRTGDNIPMATLQKMCAARKIFAAVDVQTQTFCSLLDQTYHAAGWSDGRSTTTTVLEQLHSRHHSLPHPAGTAWQLRFSHLVGYGARYYSYLMARAVASAIWQQYFERDPFDAVNGAKYRDECLSHGGGKPSKRLVSDFLGRSVDAQHLADALLAEVDLKKKLVDDLSRSSK